MRKTAERRVMAQKWSSRSRKLMLSWERMIALVACSPSHAAGTITLHITPTSQPLPAYATALDEQLLQLGMGRTHSLLWQGKCALAMWPGFFFILVQCSSVRAKAYAVTHLTEEIGWSDSKAPLDRASYCRWLNGSSLTQRPNHQGFENYFKNEMAMKPLIAHYVSRFYSKHLQVLLVHSTFLISRTLHMVLLMLNYNGLIQYWERIKESH